MNVYFSGIGGVGIGPLAQLALDAGYRVHGSDLHKSEMTESLQKQAVDVAIGQDGHEIKAANDKHKIDWFVHSAALPDNHPELEFAEQNNIKISKRAEFLNQILKEKRLKLVAVSGTHGKTTTTGMLIWLFKKLEIPVSYLVGTSLSFGPAAQYSKDSEYFIYECDEFDRNFLEYKPELSLIVSMDYDHPDTYASKEDYVNAFKQFAVQSELCITWQSIAKKLGDKAHLFVVPENQDFDLVELAGLHNRKNAWLAATAINRLELIENNVDDWQKLLQIMASFPGTNRRFEKLAKNIYSDYAHHPTEIAATIEMAGEINPRVVVVYQPHQNIRQHELLQEEAYRSCFADAEKVYWLPTYLSREDENLEILPREKLIATANYAHNIEPAKMDKRLLNNILQSQKDGQIVITMSAGNLDGWLRENLKQ